MDRDEGQAIPDPVAAAGRGVDAATAELDAFEAELELFRRGELPEERFRALRLIYGVYGQRQPGRHMVRLKLPAGRVTGAQLRAVADAAEAHGNGTAHLTTRQDVQLYDVPLDRAPALLRELAAAGITTREACFNSVRNVTACPLSGLLADEPFPVEPYAVATAEFLLRRPANQQLARKFKLAFSGCPEDCAATPIHDLGLLGRIVERDGGVRPGFQVLVGGGLGPAPYLAQVLTDFVPVEELLPTVAAVLRVYAAHGNRRNRNRSRLKFVVAKLGIEAFREAVAHARATLTRAELADAELLDHVPRESAPLVRRHLDGLVTLPPPRADWAPEPAETEGQDPPFPSWQRLAVRAHRDPERALVTVQVPLGDLSATTLRAIAELVTRFSADEARLSIDQNLVLPHVARVELVPLYQALTRLGLGEPAAGTALDVTACPGADTCNLGLTSSKGLARALREELEAFAREGGLASLRGVSIKVSGCPNACSQHHVASIGLHGAVGRLGERQLPVYQLLLGGRADGARARLARRSLRIPAKRVPPAVGALLRFFLQQRRPDETFAEFAERLPERTLDDLLRPFADLRAAGERAEFDWGQATPFGTQDLGAGECASGGFDASANLLDAVRAELAQAERLLARDQLADSLVTLGRTHYSLARTLLEAVGRRPESDYETECELRAHLIDRGLLSEAWNALQSATADLLRHRHPDREAVQALSRETHAVLAEAIAALPRLVGQRALAGAGPP
ncbi:MAG: nitrite/sulfite reductase [Deltaproteobacteria bacterium]|nr:nitrite/sulfite reductase [Deltaproteobacteria bacterium]